MGATVNVLLDSGAQNLTLAALSPVTASGILPDDMVLRIMNIPPCVSFFMVMY